MKKLIALVLILFCVPGYVLAEEPVITPEREAEMLVFFDRVLELHRENGFFERWSEDDVERFYALYREYGFLELDPEIGPERWEFPEDALMDAIDLLFGIDLEWSVERYAWVDKLLYDCGLRPFITYIIPGEGDMVEEDALNLAKDSIAAEYGDFVTREALEDWAAYRYFTQIDDTGMDTRWEFQFYPPETNAPDFLVTINAKTGECAVHDLRIE